MSDALDKCGAALAVWRSETEKLVEEMYDCFEREKIAREKGEPTQSAEAAYGYAVHQAAAVLRTVAHRHNEAVRALKAAKES